MAQWNSYSQKTAPDDTDTLMLKDNSATGAPNKRLLFSALWTWILGKLTNTTISALNTSPQTVIGGLNALNSKTTLDRAVYTPTITAGTGFTCENISCKYAKQGNIMFISGRFNVTNAGSTDGQITIPIPSGYQLYDMGVGGLGGVAKDVAPTLDTSMCTLRYKNATAINIQKGAGNDSAFYLGTGYIIFYATVFVV